MTLLEQFISEELTLKNRVVMAPMTRCRADNKENVATDLIAQYYAQRASAGLLITEGTFINEMVPGYINVPCIYTREQIDGWKKVTSAVHREGGKIFAQLWHVGRLSHPDLLNGKLPFGPSAINGKFTCYTRDGFKETVTPQAMTIEDIEIQLITLKNQHILNDRMTLTNTMYSEALLVRPDDFIAAKSTPKNILNMLSAILSR